MKRKTKLFIIVFVFIIFLSLLITFYLNISYQSKIDVENFKNVNPEIKITEEDNGISITNEKSDTLVVFYPGAKIQASAYLPLMYKIAEKGFSSFIVEFPFNLAIFNKNAVDKINRDEYKYVFLCGHSLGGVMATSYAAENKGIDGLILLASYPNEDLSGSNLPTLFIYGDRDGVLNREKYEKSKMLWSKNSKEIIIKGANHASFGNYGEQRGDNTALITTEEQQNQTVEEIVEFIKSNE